MGSVNRLDTYPFTEPAKWAGKLNGKVTIITGASVGIGRGCAKAFAAAGARVACVARREPELKSLVEEIRQSGGEAIAVVADVSARGAAKEIVSTVESQLGKVDILFNNAGISRIGPFEAEDPDLDIWWRVFEVNVRAPMALAHAVIPSMKQRNTGVILTVGSGVINLDLPVMTAYASSKAAIAKAHRALAMELKETNIRSFCVTPGMVQTELGASTDAINRDAKEHPQLKAFMAHIQEASKGGHFATVEGTSNAYVAICADERFAALNGKFWATTTDLEYVLDNPDKF